MSIAIPWNHQPYSATVKTGSYSIPAGYYARVVFTEYSQATTIDGTSIVPDLQYAAIFNSDLGVKFTNSTEYILKGWAHGGYYATSQATIEVNTGLSNTYGATSINVGVSTLATAVVLYPGDRIEVTVGAAGATNVNPFYSLAADVQGPKEFWVPTGTALVGERYLVELYNELT